MITIDRNVPIPDTSTPACAKYPWGKMKAGDSFEVTDKGDYGTVVTTSWTQWCKRNGVNNLRIVTRKMPNKKRRFWLVKKEPKK